MSGVPVYPVQIRFCRERVTDIVDIKGKGVLHTILYERVECHHYLVKVMWLCDYDEAERSGIFSIFRENPTILNKGGYGLVETGKEIIGLRPDLVFFNLSIYRRDFGHGVLYERFVVDHHHFANEWFCDQRNRIIKQVVSFFYTGWSEFKTE
jgi:hypothetical protein